MTEACINEYNKSEKVERRFATFVFIISWLFVIRSIINERYQIISLEYSNIFFRKIGMFMVICSKMA